VTVRPSSIGEVSMVRRILAGLCAVAGPPLGAPLPFVRDRTGGVAPVAFVSYRRVEP